MKTDVYLTTHRRKILLVPAGTSISTLPQEAQDFSRGLTLHGQWQIDPKEPRIGLDQEAALAALGTKGFYTATVEYRFETKE